MTPGIQYFFRVKTVNKYGSSPYSQTLQTQTSDAPPTKMIENLQLKPDSSSSKVFINWTEYPRKAYNSYDSSECCIHMVISTDARKLSLDCINPKLSDIVDGWSDIGPYTKHYVEAWFSNQLGAVYNHTYAVGYNAAAAPNTYPSLTENQDLSLARSISVKFYPMPQSELNGEFSAYNLEVFEMKEDGQKGPLVNKAIDEDIGFVGEVRELIVDKLLPYTHYKVVLSASNHEFSTASPPFDRKTYSAEPTIIGENNVRIHQTPDQIFSFWYPPERVNGQFECYEVSMKNEGNIVSMEFLEMLSVCVKEPIYELPHHFQLHLEEITLNNLSSFFTVKTKNAVFTSDPTSIRFRLEDLSLKAPGVPSQPEVDCGGVPSSTIIVTWTFKHFGNFSSAHYTKFKAQAGNGSGLSFNDTEFEALCKYIGVDEAPERQRCELTVSSTVLTYYYIYLVAYNRNGEQMSQEAVKCSTYSEEENSKQPVAPAKSPLFLAVLISLFLLILLLAVLGALYSRKNHKKTLPGNVAVKELEYDPWGNMDPGNVAVKELEYDPWGNICETTQKLES